MGAGAHTGREPPPGLKGEELLLLDGVSFDTAVCGFAPDRAPSGIVGFQ